MNESAKSKSRQASAEAREMTDEQLQNFAGYFGKELPRLQRMLAAVNREIYKRKRKRKAELAGIFLSLNEMDRNEH